MRAKKPDLFSGFNGLAVGRDGVARFKVGAAGGKCAALERFIRQHHGELSSFSIRPQFKATSQVLHSFSNPSQPDPRPATGSLKLGERRRWDSFAIVSNCEHSAVGLSGKLNRNLSAT